jgi:FkbM family methyltransferase
MEYKYRNFSIELTEGHALPFYQRQHRNYDRFLPHLAKYLEPGVTVIDVGANCGDSLAGMFDMNSKLNYVCIEPDDAFFASLEKNVSRIKTVFPNAVIHTVKTLAGKSVTNVSLEGIAGTKHAVIGGKDGSGIKARSVDDIIFSIPNSSVRLFKTDTDGFDYDVIESADKILELQHPMVFFECQYADSFQKAGFERMIAWLKTKNYSHWTLFDNFGGLVLRTVDINDVFQLLDYVWRQNQSLTTRTIYYFDILATSDKDEEFVSKLVADFVR